MKILNIVASAYRGTLEEQDDTILWLTHALRNNGADVSVLLRGNAVNYLVRGQDASGATIGTSPIRHPTVPDQDLQRLGAAGVALFAVDEDIVERGLNDAALQPVERVKRADVARLLDRFDYAWAW
jgi:sulfur transfer complex TusBCD TusB component (DsrH family)